MNHELFIPEKSRILYQNGSTRGIFLVGKLDKIKVSPEKNRQLVAERAVFLYMCVMKSQHVSTIVNPQSTNPG
jgi:hypothetical protein